MKYEAHKNQNAKSTVSKCQYPHAFEVMGNFQDFTYKVQSHAHEAIQRYVKSQVNPLLALFVADRVGAGM